MQVEDGSLETERFVLDSYAVLAFLEGEEGVEYNMLGFVPRWPQSFGHMEISFPDPELLRSGRSRGDLANSARLPSPAG